MTGYRYKSVKNLNKSVKVRGYLLGGGWDRTGTDEVESSRFCRWRKGRGAYRISYLGTTVQEGIILIERATGRSKMIASTGHCKTGADHQHPSFNRRGDQILFSNPDKNGTAQVCLIDLHQVWQDW